MDLDRSFEIYKERFSNAGQFLFTFVGNFTPDSLKPLVEKYIASLPGSNYKETWKDVGIRYPGGKIDKLIRKGKENKASVRIFFTGNTVYDEMDELQIGQLCKVMAIRLREILREDAGGVYGVGVNGGINREPVVSYSISIQFGCAPENVDKLVKMVMEEINKTKTHGAASVNVEKIIAEQTRSLENDVKENSYWRYQLEQAFFRKGNPVAILSARDKIKKLTVARTQTLANRYFDESNMARFVLLPEEN
jgi:zinc protease